LVSFVLTGGVATLHTVILKPAELKLTSGQAFDNPIIIKCIETSSSFRTLGVHITPDGSNDIALSVLISIARDYARDISGHLYQDRRHLPHMFNIYYPNYDTNFQLCLSHGPNVKNPCSTTSKTPYK